MLVSKYENSPSIRSKSESKSIQACFQSWKLASWVKEGFSQGNLLKNRNSVQLQAGYYLIKGLLLGFDATWSKEWAGDFNYNDLSIGPYVRYHFTATRISPFIDVSYQAGQRFSGNGSAITYPKVPMQTTQITPGISFGITNSLRIETSYGFQWVYLSNSTQSLGQAQIGLTYLF